MSRAVSYRHADWLSLVEPTGSFLTLPVLKRVFPEGLDRTDLADRQEARERFAAVGEDRAARTSWIEWVLKDLLRWGPRLRSGPAVPETLTHVVGEHNAVLRPDYMLAEPDGDRERVRALVCIWPAGTAFNTKVPGERWSATPSERMAYLCRACGVGVGIVSDGNQWQLVWAPVNGSPGSAVFLAELFSEEPAVLDAFTSILSAKRFFAVAPSDTIESLLTESSSAQEVVADQLGRQVRGAAEMLIASISRANLHRGRTLLKELEMSEIYSGAVTVLMRLVFLLFAEERGLLPLDDQMYASSYAVCTLREQLQSERDLFGDEPLERRSSAWFRMLALFRAVHGGITHESLRIPPYGGRLFDPDRFPFLEGRAIGEHWRVDAAVPIPVDDLTMLDVLTRLQVLNSTEGGIKEARQLSYRTLEVEQIGHVYEGLLDHSVRLVGDVVVGLVGKPGDEPEVTLIDVEVAAAGSRGEFVKWLVQMTGRTERFLDKCLDTPPGENDRQLLAAVVDNDDALIARVLPFINLVARDLRELPKVLLPGSFYSTQTSTRREGGVEYTTKDLADEVARYALEPLVYSPGPQDSPDETAWLLRPASEILALKVCDPAVGSGAILVAAGRYLADRLAEAWDAEGAPEATAGSEEVLIAARRAVADSCLYGVDRDSLATEMAKLSLWLTTMAKDRPFTFLDHAIRTGDSLLGVTNVEQVRWMHLVPSDGQRIHRTLFDYQAQLEPLVKDAVERRRRLSKIRVISIRDAEDKERLMAEADTDLRSLSVIADLVVASALSTASLKRTALDNRLLVAADLVASALGPGLNATQRDHLLSELGSTAAGWLNEGKPDNAPVRHCFHWPLQFPEVFVDREHAGFDVFIGNPPFIGGMKISTVNGVDYEAYLKVLIGGAKGAADLSAHFFRRVFELLKDDGTLGLLSTDRIAEGDTRTIGLRNIVESGGAIYRARTRFPWPGVAATWVSLTHIRKGEWLSTCNLDGVTVLAIDDALSIPSRASGEPRSLTLGIVASAGTYVYGDGLILNRDAEILNRLSPIERTFVRPYLSNQDLMGNVDSAPSRLVIDLSNNLTESEVKKSLPLLYEHLFNSVKPVRDALKGQRHQDDFWRFWDLRPTLYSALDSLDRAIACSRLSRVIAFEFVPTDVIYSDQIVVIASDAVGLLGLLQSSIHGVWIDRYKTTRGAGTRYVVSRCLRTFPLVSGMELEDEASNFVDLRSRLRATRKLSLTKVYNIIDDSSCEDDDVVALRMATMSLDTAVCHAYGWDDLELEHGFCDTDQGRRWTISQKDRIEILDRLLELNKERYESEIAAGLHGGSKKTSKSKKKDSAPTGIPTLFGAPIEKETGT